VRSPSVASTPLVVEELAPGAVAPDGDRPFPARAFLALDVAFFVVMAAFAVLAPCGDWANEVFGVVLWRNADPGGPYVISAVHFFDQRYPPFMGHPGTTLQLLLHLAARTTHGILVLGGVTTPFVAFWARHIAWLFALCGLVVTALHVVSFHALQAYARRLGLSRRTAFVAVLAYATSFPVLYYGVRVSPEPLLLALTLGAILLADSCSTALASGRRVRACALAGGAGALAVLALFTKVHLAFPLAPLVVIQVLTQARPGSRVRFRRIGEGLLLAGVALASGVFVFLVASLKVPWRAFLDFWLPYTPIASAGGPHSGLRLPDGVGLAVVGALAQAVGKGLVGRFQATPNGLFTLSDGPFLLLGCLGLVLLGKRQPQARSRLFWAAALCACVFPVVAFRGQWHYYILYLAFAAVGFATLIDSWLTRGDGASQWPGGSLRRSVLATLLVHAASVTFFFAAKVHDVASYRRAVAPYLSALEGLPPGTRAAIVSRGFKFWLLDGGYPSYVERDRLELTRTFESSGFIAKRPEWITPELVRRLNVTCVIDARSGTVRLVPIEEWLALGAPTTP
jgi:hypothetical protein